ncbi:hypothetical protein LP7551_02069 [Roseibium album]|nr:hypothetical protein LP7551_02069 [Roseibium album]
MSSDDVLDALHVVLSDLADGDNDVPAIGRNETLDSALEALDSGARGYANMVDGDLERVNQSLGSGGGYEMRQTALLELVVKAATDAERRSALKTILSRVNATLEASTGGLAHWEINGIDRLDQATDGDPHVTGITVQIACEFVSDVPY